MNILITGNTGFLGRHLVKTLDQASNTLYYANSRENNLLFPLEGYRSIPCPLDYIIHCAVDTKAGDYCITHHGDQWERNQLMNTNILRYWRLYQPQAKMITFGSSCSYDAGLDKKTENKYMDGDPVEELKVYAWTKRMLLLGLESYAKQFDLKYLYFIPNTLYGPNFELNDQHFIFDLIKKIAAGKYEDKEVVLWGTGNQLRELIYIDDAVDLILESMSEISNERLNLGSGKEYSIAHYAGFICETLDYDFDNIKFDTTAYEGQLSKKLEPSPIIGPCNQMPLPIGIRKTIEYYVGKKYDMSIM